MLNGQVCSVGDSGQEGFSPPSAATLSSQSVTARSGNRQLGLQKDVAGLMWVRSDQKTGSSVTCHCPRREEERSLRGVSGRPSALVARPLGRRGNLWSLGMR